VYKVLSARDAELQGGRPVAQPTDPHTANCVFKKQKQKQKKPSNQMKQKMSETGKLKAGRTKPEHKNGGSD